MIISCRYDFKQILDVMVYDSSSDPFASSEGMNWTLLL